MSKLSNQFDKLIDLFFSLGGSAGHSQPRGFQRTGRGYHRASGIPMFFQQCTNLEHPCRVLLEHNRQDRLVFHAIDLKALEIVFLPVDLRQFFSEIQHFRLKIAHDFRLVENLFQGFHGRAGVISTARRRKHISL